MCSVGYNHLDYRTPLHEVYINSSVEKRNSPTEADSQSSEIKSLEKSSKLTEEATAQARIFEDLHEFFIKGRDADPSNGKEGFRAAWKEKFSNLERGIQERIVREWDVELSRRSNEAHYDSVFESIAKEREMTPRKEGDSVDDFIDRVFTGFGISVVEKVKEGKTSGLAKLLAKRLSEKIDYKLDPKAFELLACFTPMLDPRDQNKRYNPMELLPEVLQRIITEIQ